MQGGEGLVASIGGGGEEDEEERSALSPTRTSVSSLVQRVLGTREDGAPDDVSSLLAQVSAYQAELESQNEELHAVQRELSDSRDRYFELYELAPAGYVTMDPRSTILETNLRMASLLGEPRTRLLGRPFVAWLSPSCVDSFHLEMRALFAERRRMTTEVEIVRPSGSFRHVRIDGVCVDGGGAPQCRAVITDVDELKHAESHIRSLNLELAMRIDEMTRKNRQLADEVSQRILLSEDLDRRSNELRLLSRQVITSQEEERRRIARELHDETGQSLGAVVAQLRGVEDRLSDAALSAEVRGLRERVSAALRDLRRISHGLHPSALASLGLASAIQSFLDDQARVHGVEMRRQIVGMAPGERLPEPVELVLFRVVQAAVTNVVKHARAAHVSVVLVRHDRHLRLVIEDDGCGFDPRHPASPGLGLAGMRERVGLVGGEMHVESSPGKGTTLAVSISLEPVNGSHPSDDRR